MFQEGLRDAIGGSQGSQAGRHTRALWHERGWAYATDCEFKLLFQAGCQESAELKVFPSTLLSFDASSLVLGGIIAEMQQVPFQRAGPLTNRWLGKGLTARQAVMNVACQPHAWT